MEIEIEPPIFFVREGVVQEIPLLHSTRRVLETWYGRDIVPHADEKGQSIVNVNIDLSLVRECSTLLMGEIWQKLVLYLLFGKPHVIG